MEQQQLGQPTTDLVARVRVDVRQRMLIDALNHSARSPREPLEQLLIEGVVSSRRLERSLQVGQLMIRRDERGALLLVKYWQRIFPSSSCRS